MRMKEEGCQLFKKNYNIDKLQFESEMKYEKEDKFDS